MDREDADFKIFIKRCFKNDKFLTNEKNYPYADEKIYQRFYNFIKQNRDRKELTFSFKGVFNVKYIRRFQEMGLQLRPKHFYAIENLPETVKCLLSGINLCKNCGTLDRHGILKCNYCWQCFKFFDVLDDNCDGCGAESGFIPDAVKSEQELYIKIKERNIENLFEKLNIDQTDESFYDKFNENGDTQMKEEESDASSERSFSPVPSENENDDTQEFSFEEKSPDITKEIIEISSSSDIDDKRLRSPELDPSDLPPPAWQSSQKVQSFDLGFKVEKKKRLSNRNKLRGMKFKEKQLQHRLNIAQQKVQSFEFDPLKVTFKN